MGKTIQYAPLFKIKAVEMKETGYANREIFESNGLPYYKDQAKVNLKRWRIQYNTYGKESFFTETRGHNINGKTGRPKKEEITY